MVAFGSERVVGSKIDFDEASHTYSVDGKPLEPVTKVIASILPGSSWWKPEHRIRGTFVHAICEAVDAGDWDEEATVVPEGFPREEIIARGRGYQRFLDESGFRSILVEQRMASVSLGIAGTLDRFGQITKGAYAGRYAIVDLKSGLPTPAAILQLALYEELFKRNPPNGEPDPTLRIILELRRDGTIRPQYLEGKQDVLDALALVRVFQFKQRNGL